ncbi:hypothetical protein OE88DRAFT_770109 [Heliocybe sulcata]|uniref:Uncharacterized protein n=1 Tax=Heliocybe sulcata TaxID=5364 RepID=A0A5C3MQ73_9AGAM|nr:hypothetical protein OE88DRAFT_770109 [Heliocybe sulcata]
MVGMVGDATGRRVTGFAADKFDETLEGIEVILLSLLVLPASPALICYASDDDDYMDKQRTNRHNSWLNSTSKRCPSWFFSISPHPGAKIQFLSRLISLGYRAWPTLPHQSESTRMASSSATRVLEARKSPSMNTLACRSLTASREEASVSRVTEVIWLCIVRRPSQRITSHTRLELAVVKFGCMAGLRIGEQLVWLDVVCGGESTTPFDGSSWTSAFATETVLMLTVAKSDPSSGVSPPSACSNRKKPTARIVVSAPTFGDKGNKGRRTDLEAGVGHRILH